MMHPIASQIAKFMGPTWGPLGSCRPRMGPTLAPWNLLSGLLLRAHYRMSFATWNSDIYSASVTVMLYSIDRSHVTTAIWWPLGVAVVSVACMRIRWVSHAWKYTQWNIFLFESSDKSPYRTNPYHIGFRYEASLNFKYLFWAMSQWYLHFNSHSFVIFVQTTRTRG